MASPAIGTPIAPVSGTTLTGARGVEVNGISYDVTFQHGSCDTVSGNECTPPGYFNFNNYTSAFAASQALIQLLNDVFASGVVQSIVRFRQDRNSCYVVTSYAASLMGSNPAFSVTDANPFAVSGSSTTLQDGRFSVSSVTSAVWSVPEPASAALLLPAAAALLATRRRKQSS